MATGDYVRCTFKTNISECSVHFLELNKVMGRCVLVMILLCPSSVMETGREQQPWIPILGQ